MRWRLILPILGLSLFTFVSYRSFKGPRRGGRDTKYFWWSSIRLDRAPLRPRAPSPCKPKPDTAEACIEWDDLEYSSSDSELPAALLAFSAFPAFIVGLAIVAVLGRFGVSQVSTFMVSMPFLLIAWYYFFGWRLDRRRSKRRAVPG